MQIATMQCGHIIIKYRIVQNIRETKLSWLGHLVSIRGKLLRLYKNLPYPCHCIRKFVDKTFVFQGKTANSVNVFSLECFVLYGS